MSFSEKLRKTHGEAMTLYKAIPETLQAYQGLMKAASKEGVLSGRVKELMALSIAVRAQCEGCIVFHVNAAIKHGASREEVAETLSIAIEMGGGPATVYSGMALAVFDELKGSTA